jgi:hypothetical protein
MYRPKVIFATVSITFAVVGLIPFVRYLVLYISHNQSGHLQSLIFGTTCLIIAVISAVVGVLADLIHINRILHEETLEQLKAAKYNRQPNE